MLAIKITFADGSIGRMFPAPEARLDGEDDTAFFTRIAIKDCPADATWQLVDESEIPPPAAPVPASITRRQCAKRMLAMGMITGEEALAMTRNGTPPAMVAASFAQLSPEDAVLAAIDFAADTYMRSNPLLQNLMLATGAGPAEIDDFFREAALL